MVRGGALEGGVVAGLALGAGLVGDRAHHDEGHAVERGRLGDGRALHLAAQAAEGLHYAAAVPLRGDELVAGGHAARQRADLGRLGGRRSERRLAQAGVRRELRALPAGDEPGGVAERSHGEVVLHAVGGHHEVADVERAGVQRAGDAGVDEVRAAEAVAEHLRADAGVDLADPALHDHHVLLAEPAGEEVHAGHGLGLRVRELLAQELDLHVHRADDADPHDVPPLVRIADTLASQSVRNPHVV